MEKHARKQIMEWLTAPETCYLFGAGCSKCANKPLIDELTQLVLNDVDDELVELFKTLRSVNDRAPTIEDLMNHLLQYRNILTTSNTSLGNITIKDIDRWIPSLKRNIVEKISDDWKPSCYHVRFFSRLGKPHGYRDIFSLNYDTVIEASLDYICILYIDGFQGTNLGWFDAEIFEDNSAKFRIFKLHGSINWIRDETERVRRTNSIGSEPVVVYPSERKYIETQFGVYETLMSRFRSNLRTPKQNTYLITLGYSFNDDHINEAIHDSINAPDSFLTVIAFIGPEQDLRKQVCRIQDFATRCDSRFNAFIGKSSEGLSIGNVVSEEVQEEILKAELWMFENFVALIDGGVS